MVNPYGLAALLGVAFSFILTSAGSGANPATQPALPELGRYLPVWTQGYLDVKDLGSRLGQLDWLIQVAESRFEPSTRGLASKPASGPGLLAEQFDVLLRNNLGLTSQEFLNEVVGRHFAAGWGGPVFRDQFGLVCRVKSPGIIGKLLTAAKAERLSLPAEDSAGPVRIKTYRLAIPNILAAVVGEDILILATSAPASKASMFYAMVELAAGQSENSLYRNRQFQAACRPVRPDYHFLFVFLTGEKVNSRQAEFAGTIYDELHRNVSFMSLADLPNPHGLGMQFIIQPRFLDPAFLPDRPLRIEPVLQNMGEGMDLRYALEINPGQWYRRIVELSDRGAIDAQQFRAVIDLFMPDPQLRETCLASLGPELMVLASSEKKVINVQPGGKSLVFNSPEGALIVRTSNPMVTFTAADRICNMLSGFIALQTLASGAPGSSGQVLREVYKGHELHYLDLGEIFPPSRMGKFPGWHVELTWTIVDHYLVAGGSRELARKVIDRALAAKHEKTPVPEPIPQGIEPVHWILSFNPSRIANHVMTFEPVVNRIWRTMAGSSDNTANTKKRVPVVLGIGTRELKASDQKSRTVQVAAVFPGYPAWGRLQIGDVILTVNNLPIDPASPQKDLHAKVNTVISQGRLLRMTLLRTGRKIDTVIPLEKRNLVISPQSMRLLHKILTALGQKFQNVDFACTYAPDGQIRINCEFKSNPNPHPTSQPQK
jgi:hypothetical protein